MPLQSSGLVRVCQLLQPSDNYDGWKLNQRPPQVDDVGTVLDILKTDGFPDKYVVEMSGLGGIDRWLGDFFAEELELTTRHPPRSEAAPPRASGALFP